MRKRRPFSPGPDIALKKPLVWSICFPLCPEHGVMGGLMERFSEELPDLGVGRAQPDPPATAKDLYAMCWVVPHEVEMVWSGVPC